MNISNTSQPAASWSQTTASAVSTQNVSSLANQQHGGPGTPSGADHESKGTILASPQSSNLSGTTLKEHDLLGLSEVSSSSTRPGNSSRNGYSDEGHQPDDLNLNLNLGSTDLRLGPQEAKKNGDGGFSYQRNPVPDQGSSSVSENGKFLGGLDGGSKRNDQGSFVTSDRRSTNTDQNTVCPDSGSDRGFSYTGLTGERAPPTLQAGRADALESTACRPVLESDSFHKWQQPQLPHSQADEGPRTGFTGPLSNFAGARVAFAPLKASVTGAKRPFDRIGIVTDARSFNEGRSCLPSPGNANPSAIVVNGASSEVDSKAPLYQSWGSKSGPTWQMLQHSGGSFGPFPSQAPARNSVMPTLSKPTADVSSVGVDPAQKVWEAAHTKSLQEPATALVQKLANSAETKAALSQGTSPGAEAASASRAVTPPAHAVGWPPLRSFRKSTLAAQSRPTPVETQSRPPPPVTQPATPAAASSQSNFWGIKVYMDGVPIGRKVDLKTNSSYEKLSLVLEEMFRGFVNGQQSGQGARDMSLPSDKRNFLHGSDYVLTYEDQDGDLMLVGDVPWTMFLDTVKRLRIMKGSEAIGLGSRSQEKVGKVQSTV